jgi:hypothetical protein
MPKYRKAFVVQGNELAGKLALGDAECIEYVDSLSEAIGLAQDWSEEELSGLAQHYLACGKHNSSEDALVEAAMDIEGTVGIYLDKDNIISFP